MMLKQEIKNLSLILALCTAGLYTYGLIFHQGYLSYWGVKESLFVLNFERTLFQGFIAVGYLGAKALVPLVVASILCFILVFVFGWIFKKLKEKGWFERETTQKNALDSDKAIPIPLKYSGLFVFISYWALVVFLMLLLLVLVASEFGKTAAQSQHERYQEGSEPGVIFHLSNGEEKRGLTIACSNSHCAFFNGETAEVYPLSGIDVIKSAVKELE
jgi:hypothetical protein